MIINFEGSLDFESWSSCTSVALDLLGVCRSLMLYGHGWIMCLQQRTELAVLCGYGCMCWAKKWACWGLSKVRTELAWDFNSEDMTGCKKKKRKKKKRKTKQSWLPAFWKNIQNTQEIIRTLFNWMKQDKTCTFLRKSSFSVFLLYVAWKRGLPQKCACFIQLKSILLISCVFCSWMCWAKNLACWSFSVVMPGLCVLN